MYFENQINKGWHFCSQRVRCNVLKISLNTLICPYNRLLSAAVKGFCYVLSTTINEIQEFALTVVRYIYHIRFPV